MIDPKNVEITDMGGTIRKYRIGKIPYLSGGREVASQFVTSASPKIGNYKTNENLSRIMFANTAVILENGRELKLVTDELVNNHVPDFWTGVKLEQQILEHNLGFSVAGKVLEFQQTLTEELPGWILKMATLWQQSLHKQDSARDMNSKPSTQ